MTGARWTLDILPRLKAAAYAGDPRLLVPATVRNAVLSRCSMKTAGKRRLRLL